MEIIEIKTQDKEYINEIIELEEKTFGKNGGVDIWILMPLISFGKVFAIKEGDEIIGACEFIISSEKSEAYLYGISIIDEFKNFGYGKKLLEYSENYFKNIKIKYISLTVSPENENAIMLYNKRNYMIKYLEEDYYGKGEHRYIMIKEL